MWFLSNILCGSLRSLQAQAGASLEESSSAGAPSAQSKSSLTVVKFSCGGKTKATLNLSPSGMTCERLTDALGMDLWMSSVAGSRVKTLAQQALGQELKANEADSGKSLRASLAKYDHASRSWKIARHLFGEDLAQSSETWPRWGMTQGGELYPLLMSGSPSCEREYGLLPAPLKSMAESFLGGPIRTAETWATTSRLDHMLIGIWKRWENRENNGRLKPAVICHPTFAAWVMGWPMNWTNCAPLETAKFQSWLQQHGAF